MFWGLIMEPDRRYTQIVKRSFHISMASLDMNTSENGPAQVMCRYKDRNYLLCTLKNPDLLQCALDLDFKEGTEVSFATNGKAYIHLSGYLTEFEDEDGLSLEDLEEQEEEEADEEEIAEEVGDKRKKKKAVKDTPPAKKAKLNGFQLLNDAEEEESDDDDYQLEEENGDEEADSDEGEEVEGEDEEESSEDEDDVEEEEVKQEVKPKLSKKEKKKLQQEKEKAKKEPSLKKQVLKGGVSIQDLKEGDGPLAKNGSFITVYYEGRLEKNNKMFDSLTKGPGFRFRLGAGEVIKGWDKGIIGMKVGGVRKITCPPNVAYGAKGSPPAIPPSSTLLFTVTLKKIN
ncbi:unnamed protein product [Ceutorhynchus assimilis]|uniref:peptidylprolyl isomerase n=1 Tax=Ceutorhynchus assimilis TaxID=467358 RepID=A0A9N9QL87_9CUCU|nr:unnamed protein product [Ceutorhynchus assimilis]